MPGPLAARIIQNARTFQQAAGGVNKLVSQYKPITNKGAAANSYAYGSNSLISRYRMIASTGGGKKEEFLKTDQGWQNITRKPNSILPTSSTESTYHVTTNGGIYKPVDVGLWGGKFYRVQYAARGTNESGVVNAALSGAWWMSQETFLYICGISNSSTDLLQHLGSQLALGYKLDLSTTRIAEATINGPTAAYSGRANETRENYQEFKLDKPDIEPLFPTIYGNPIIAQLYIPGIRDVDNAANLTVINSVFKTDATNTYDAVGAFTKFGSVVDAEALGNERAAAASASNVKGTF